MDGTVCARRDRIVIPTCLAGRPDRNPLFFERRINQLSDGNVYPLPFADTITGERANREYDAIWTADRSAAGNPGRKI